MERRLRNSTPLIGLALALASFGLAAPALAVELDGSWNGGGSIVMGSGSKENARCRVQYSKRSSTSYDANATCATASVKVSQTAVLRKVGENTYTGTFHNSEYNLSGTISVIVRGNAQSVQLSSSSASASLRLNK
jgi:hypothetical protein